MPYFNWTPEMAIGLARIDDDHKVLVAIMNRLFDNLETDQDDETMEQSFKALVRYTEIHFGREEAVLSVVNYPDLSSHRDDHNLFIKDINQMQKEFGDSTSRKEKTKLLDYLKNWLTNHIMIDDMAYKSFIIDNPKAAKASMVFSSVELWTQR